MATQDMDIDKIVRISLIILIVAWTFKLLHPLLGILAWGFILSVILFPIYNWLNQRLGNRPTVSATIVTLCMILLVFGIAGYITKDIARTVRNFSPEIYSSTQIIPKPPASVANWPLVGKPIFELWTSASNNLETVIKTYSTQLLDAGKYLLAKFVETSKELLLFLVAIIFSGFLLTRGNSFMTFLRKFAKRIARDRGAQMLNIIRDTIQNVSRGVIGIALLQTIILAILLLIAKVPGAALLSLLGLLLSIMQLGLFILVVPISIWLFMTKSFGLALIITIFLLLDTLIDNLLKPIVLARGLPTPMIVIFIGVIGGILVYGLVGIFVGPVVLAIAYDLMSQWVENDVLNVER